MEEIKEVIIVEGRYDKNTLAQVVKATILETKGYGIFNDREKMALIRRLAQGRGVIILTDSDSAGFLIRSRLKGSLPPGARVLHAYIPDRMGKERRKKAPGKEGKLGVEGMHRDTLLKALKQAGATFQDKDAPNPPLEMGPKVTKTHLYQAGLTGQPGSEKRRRALLKKLDLPEQLTTNGLLELINILFPYEEAMELLAASKSPHSETW